MKFINYLESITGVSVFPLTSLLLFFIFFLAVATWSLKADKKHILSLKQLPFPEGENE